VVLGVEQEPDRAFLPLQLALLAAHGGDAVPEGPPAVLEPGLVAVAHIDDRGRPPRAVVGRERALGGQQVVELPTSSPAPRSSSRGSHSRPETCTRPWQSDRPAPIGRPTRNRPRS
jgi:hypothetical protein